MDTMATTRPIKRGAIGILHNGLRLLVIRRAKHLVRGHAWCFPGGHIEKGETSRDAIQRELQEELSVTTTPVERLGSIQLAQMGYVLVVWRMDHHEQRLVPNPREIAEMRWLMPSDVRSLKNGLPSNERVLTMLGF